MSDQAEKKVERIHLRLTRRVKQRIEKAAALSGTTMTDFVIASIAEQADRVIERHERITLSEKDAEIFFQAILNPRKPNQALRKAMKHHRELQKKEFARILRTKD